MKKILSLALAGILLLSLSGCGSREPAPSETTQPELLLVESHPSEAPTVPETEAPETLPALLETAPTLSPTEPAVPETRPTEMPKPTVTKSPTPESILAGQDAWFVAHAEDADGIRWWFTDPENREARNDRDLPALFPGLTVQGAGEDTMILGRVPAEMTGWAIQAEFYNASGSSFTDSVVLEVTEAPAIDADAAYAAVLENCRFLQQYDPNGGSSGALAEKDLYQLAEGLDLLEGGLGYALRDLDGNGIPELILGCTGSNAFGANGGDIVYALFTLKDGSPVKLLQSWVRNRHYLCGENRIYNEGSSGAAHNMARTLILQSGALRALHCVWSSTEADGQTPAFYHSTDGSMTESQINRISQREYDRLCAQLLEQPREALPPLAPIF